MADAGGIRAGRSYVEIGAKDDQLRAVLARTEARLRNFGQSLIGVGSRLAGLGAAGLAGFGVAIGQFASMGDSLQKMSARTGISVESLSEFKFASEQSGSSIEAFEGVVRAMQGNLQEAANGSGEAQAKLVRLGLTLRDLRGLSTEDVLERIAEQISRIPSPVTQARIALEHFGTTAVLPMIKGGAAGIRELRQEARDLGVTLDTETAENAAATVDSMNRMRQSLRAVAVSIGAAVAPALRDVLRTIQPVIRSVIDWTRENPNLVSAVALLAGGITALGAGLVGLGVAVVAGSIGLRGIATAATVGLTPLRGMLAVIRSLTTAFGLLGAARAAPAAAAALTGAGAAAGAGAAGAAAATASRAAAPAALVLGGAGLAATAGKIAPATAAVTAAATAQAGILRRTLGGAIAAVTGGLTGLLAVGRRVFVGLTIGAAVLGAKLALVAGLIAGAVAIGRAVFGGGRESQQEDQQQGASAPGGAPAAGRAQQGQSRAASTQQTVTERIRTVAVRTWTAVETAATRAWSSVTATTRRAVESVHSTFTSTENVVGRTFLAITSTATRAWDVVRDTKVGQTITSTFAAVRAASASTWGTVSTAAATAWQTVRTDASAAWQSVRATATQAVRGISDAIKAGNWSLAFEIASVAIQLEWAKMVGYLEQRWLDFQGVFSDATFGMRDVALTAWGGIQRAWVNVTSFLIGDWASFTQGVSDAWTATTTYIAAAGEVAWGTIRGAWDVLTTAWSATTDFLVSAWTASTSTITGAWEAVTSFLSSTWTATVGAISSIWDTFASTFPTVASAITTAWQGVVAIFEKLTGLVGKLWEKLSDTRPVKAAMGLLGAAVAAPKAVVDIARGRGVTGTDPEEVERQRQERLSGVNQGVEDARSANTAAQTKARTDLNASRAEAASRLEARKAELQQRLDTATGEARTAVEQAQAKPAEKGKDLDQGLQQTKQKFDVAGTFNSAIAGQLGPSSVSERMAIGIDKLIMAVKENVDATKDVAKNTRDGMGAAVA